MILSRFLGMKIRVLCVMEELQHDFGEGPIVEIVLVPYKTNDPDIRYNHFVPAKLKQTNEPQKCVAEEFQRCVAQDDSEWICCGDCHKWSHVVCATYHSVEELVNTQIYTCGCSRESPFKLGSAFIQFLADEQVCRDVISNMETEIKIRIEMMCRNEYPSWRLAKFLYKKRRPELLSQCCMGVPSEEVGITLLTFMDAAAPKGTEKDFIQLVIFPEILIWILTILNDGTRLFTEYVLKHSNCIIE